MKTELKITLTDESGIKISYTEDGKAMDLDNSANRTAAYLILAAAKETLAAAWGSKRKRVIQNNRTEQ